MKKDNSVATKSKEFIKPIVESLGYTLVDVDYEKKQTGYNLTVYIENPSLEPISLDDCEKVHRAIDEPLDELNPTNDESYILNVASCGVDWAFRRDVDYERNLGQMVDVSLYAPINKKKSYSGTLVEYTDTTITIKEKTIITIEKSAIAKICKHIEF